MPQRGRPPQPGTVEEKAALRREKVRLYVKAHRARKKNTTATVSSIETCAEARSSTSPSSSINSNGGGHSQDGICKVGFAQSESVSDEEADRQNVNATPDQHLPRRSATTQPMDSRSLAIMKPRGGKEFVMALIATFRSQFLPPSVCIPKRQEFGSELVTPCSAWITTAYEFACKQDSGALKSTILAIGLTLTGGQHHDVRLKLLSLDVYRKALRQVRTDLKPLESGQTTNYLVPYLTCLTAAMYEMLHDGFSANIAKHVAGAISLMELLPRDKTINRLLSDLLLEDLSMWEIAFALKNRYPSRLRSLRQRKGARTYRIAGNAGGKSYNATILGDLLDAADDIPTIMACMDEFRAEPRSDLKFRGYETAAKQLSGITASIDEWALRFHTRYGPIYVQVNRPVGEVDSGTQTVRFVSYEVAASWVYCLTFLICALDTNIEALALILHLYNPGQRSPTLQPNNDIRRSRVTDLRSRLRTSTIQLIEAMCIFIPQPKGIVGQSLVLFPLDRCKSMLKKELGRLHEDLNNLKIDCIEDETDILQEVERVSQAMIVYETLEQTLTQTGMSLMPDD